MTLTLNPQESAAVTILLRMQLARYHYDPMTQKYLDARMRELDLEPLSGRALSVLVTNVEDQLRPTNAPACPRCGLPITTERDEHGRLCGHDCLHCGWEDYDY